jgi:hypothetical protein
VKSRREVRKCSTWNEMGLGWPVGGSRAKPGRRGLWIERGAHPRGMAARIPPVAADPATAHPPVAGEPATAPPPVVDALPPTPEVNQVANHLRQSRSLGGGSWMIGGGRAEGG